MWGTLLAKMLMLKCPDAAGVPRHSGCGSTRDGDHQLGVKSRLCRGCSNHFAAFAGHSALAKPWRRTRPQFHPGLHRALDPFGTFLHVSGMGAFPRWKRWLLQQGCRRLVPPSSCVPCCPCLQHCCTPSCDSWSRPSGACRLPLCAPPSHTHAQRVKTAVTEALDYFSGIIISVKTRSERKLLRLKQMNIQLAAKVQHLEFSCSEKVGR